MKQKPKIKVRTRLTNAQFMGMIFDGLEPEEAPVVLRIAGRIDDHTRWPVGNAWTPELDLSDGEANWFFTLSTYRPRDGEYRRQKQNFCRAFGIYADDVGTKVPMDRIAACPPTYLVETSPNNFHAGYLFDTPSADLQRVQALQDALAEAGLCDKGAKGPGSRVGRLPVSVNGKYEPAARCKLAAWHPERRYSIDEIIERLELGAATKHDTPSRDAGADEIYRPRSAENPVLIALREAGLYKASLGGGKHDITCPWVEEHTDAIDHGTAYWEPNELYPLGGFKCLHSHGDSKRIHDLLDFLQVSRSEAKNRPVIRCIAGALHQVVDRAERELAEGGTYYQRGGLIVTVVEDPENGETRIKPATANALTKVLSSVASWEKFDARSQAYVPTDPPVRHVNVLFGGDNFLHLPVLRAIARQPYLREDGTLMTATGFDRASGMYGAFAAADFPVPEAPTEEDAGNALALLDGLLDEFAFASPGDRVAGLAALITGAIRVSLPVAPAFHLRAPAPGSGKSYFCRLAALFASPAPVKASQFPRDEVECGKVLLAKLLESPPAIVWDNLTTDFTPFTQLASCLSEEFISNRVLGYSKDATVSTRTLMLSSGNNVGPRADMTRRVVVIALDPKVESPAERRFAGDPVAVVRAHRAKYVTAALTVVRAYIVAGCPEVDLAPLGGYEAWTRLVRAPLAWLGLLDPAASIYENLRDDPDRELLGRLLGAWHEVWGSQRVTVKTVLAKVESVTARGGTLAEVVAEIAGERGTEINRRKLGWWLRRQEQRIVRSMKLVRDGNDRSGTVQWRVVSDADQKKKD